MLNDPSLHLIGQRGASVYFSILVSLFLLLHNEFRFSGIWGLGLGGGARFRLKKSIRELFKDSSLNDNKKLKRKLLRRRFTR